jgi:hypothetical protein
VFLEEMKLGEEGGFFNLEDVDLRTDGELEREVVSHQGLRRDRLN